MAWQRKQLMRVAAAAALAISTTTSGVVVFAQDNPDTQVETQPARPYLGVRLTDGENGVEVVAVGEGSPAEAAGVEAGDVLVRIGDTDVSTVSEASAAVAALAAGDVVSIVIQRDGEEQTLDATLGEAPSQVATITRPGRGDRLEEVFGRLGGLNFGYNSETNQWTVNDLAEDSPLYEAGLRSGDVVTAVNGEALEGPDMLGLFGTLAQSGTVTLTIERDGESQDIEIATADLFSFDGAPQMFQFGNGGEGGAFQIAPFAAQGGRLGLSFVPLDEETAAENDVTTTEGALVMEVTEDSPAAEAGLEAGDIITAVNGEPVNEEWTLRNRIAAYEPGDVVTLDVLRGDETLQIEVTLGEPEFSLSQGMMPFGNFNFDGQGMPFEFGNGMQGLPFGFDMQIPLPGGELPEGFTAPSSPNV